MLEFSFACFWRLYKGYIKVIHFFVSCFHFIMMVRFIYIVVCSCILLSSLYKYNLSVLLFMVIGVVSGLGTRKIKSTVLNVLRVGS